MYPQEQRYFLFNLPNAKVLKIKSVFFEPLNKNFEGNELSSLLNKISSLNRRKIIANFPAEEFDYLIDKNPI